MESQGVIRQLGVLVCVLFGVFGPSSSPVQLVLAAEQAQASPPPTETGSGLVDSLSFADRTAPIDISSRSLEFFLEEKRVRYHNQVVATQGDVKLTCNLLTVIYEELDEQNSAKKSPTPSPATANASSAASLSSRQRLKEVIAEGDVKLTTENGYATGEKLVFNESKRTVTLSGNAVLHEGMNQVSGDRVIVYLDEKRSVVEGRAHMRLIPQSETKKGAASQ